MSIYQTITCCKCGIEFGLPVAVYKQREDDGKMFSCPNGHEQHFTKSNVQTIKDLQITIIKRNSEIQRLENYIQRLQGRNEAFGYLIRTLKGVNTKYRKRLYPHPSEN